MKSKKKFSVSVSTDVLENLRSSASKENMSVNRFINKTLENFAVWNSHNSEFIPIRRILLEKFLERFTHEEIGVLAESIGRTGNKDTVLRITNQFDLTNMLKAFETWLMMTGFPYSHDIHGSVHRFLVLHDLGDKWSLYLAKLMSTSLNQIGIIPKFEYTGRIFSITIDLKNLDDAKKRTEKQIEILGAEIKRIESK